MCLPLKYIWVHLHRPKQNILFFRRLLVLTGLISKNPNRSDITSHSCPPKSHLNYFLFFRREFSEFILKLNIPVGRLLSLQSALRTALTKFCWKVHLSLTQTYTHICNNHSLNATKLQRRRGPPVCSQEATRGISRPWHVLPGVGKGGVPCPGPGLVTREPPCLGKNLGTDTGVSPPPRKEPGTRGHAWVTPPPPPRGQTENITFPPTSYGALKTVKYWIAVVSRDT